MKEAISNSETASFIYKYLRPLHKNVNFLQSESTVEAITCGRVS